MPRKVALLNQIQHEIPGFNNATIYQDFSFACRGQRLVVQRDSDGDVRRGWLGHLPPAGPTRGLALLAVNETGSPVRIEQIVVCHWERRPAPLQGHGPYRSGRLLPGAPSEAGCRRGHLHPPAFQPPGELFGDTEVFWNSLKRRTRAEASRTISDHQSPITSRRAWSRCFQTVSCFTAKPPG